MKESVQGGRSRKCALLDGIYRSLQLNERPQRILFLVTVIILTVYTGVITLAQTGYYTAYNMPFMVLSVLVAVPCIWFLVYLAGRSRGLATCARNGYHRLLVFGVFFLLTFAVCFLWQRAYWPGALDYDTLWQYQQALTGEYTDWHPVLHTILFFWIPLQFYQGPSVVIMFEDVLFSCSVACLFYTLYDLGLSVKWIVISWLFIMLNPNTSHLMLYPMKDGAMSIFALFFFTQLLRMYADPGKWGGGRRGICRSLLLGLTAFLVNGMRHNAILLVVTAFIVMLIGQKNLRRKILLSLCVFVALTVIWKGPVCSALNVKQPGNRQAETLGLPMTILCDIYMTNPDNMDEDVLEFMQSLASEQTWEDNYSLGNFNSIKFKGDTGVSVSSRIEEKGTAVILEYTWRSAVRNPLTAVNAVIGLTRIVWQTDGGSGWSIGLPSQMSTIANNIYDIEYHDGNEFLQSLTTAYFTYERTSVFRYLYNYNGILILAMLIVAVARIGRAGIASALLVLAPMAYNFGTMLLLSGIDFRFFNYNFLIAVPYMVLLFMERSAAERGLRN